jgi:hypothetical protein
MRRPLLIAYLALAAWTALPAMPAFAQYGGGGGGGGPGGRGGGGGGDSSADDAAKAKRDEEWSAGKELDLPGKKNAGPCPYVKVLYDAARYEEFVNGRVASDSVGYTGEIQNLASGCEYKINDPIHVEMELLFAFGRGPAATGSSKDYSYWVAVTDRNNEVIDKQYFTVHAAFPAGEDRVLVTDRINGIKIPRANSQVSGANFEVLVGFDVTPDMVDFNRQGKRFRVNAGAPAAPQ